MYLSGADRTPERWIIENPWLRNAFRHAVEEAAPAGTERICAPEDGIETTALQGRADAGRRARPA